MQVQFTQNVLIGELKKGGVLLKLFIKVKAHFNSKLSSWKILCCNQKKSLKRAFFGKWWMQYHGPSLGLRGHLLCSFSWPHWAWPEAKVGSILHPNTTALRGHFTLVNACKAVKRVFTSNVTTPTLPPWPWGFDKWKLSFTRSPLKTATWRKSTEISFSLWQSRIWSSKTLPSRTSVTALLTESLQMAWR